MAILMTKEEAHALAKFDRDYVAKKIRGPRHAWGVWCWSSDHWVEFDQQTIDAAMHISDAEGA
jgi:hypothetical protein